jgi:TolA-binding protein
MRRWHRAITGVAALGVVLLVTSALPASADTSTTTPLTTAEQATQTNVENLLSGLQGVVGQINSNAVTGGALQSTGTDPTAMINSAEAQVSGMSGSSLDQLQSALNADPNWQQIPQQVSSSVNQFATAASGPAPKFPGTFTSDCSTAGDAYSEFTAVEALNEVQSAAQAAMLAAPGVIAVFVGIDVPTGVKIALAVIWGVANAAFLALSQVLAVSTDCEATAFGNAQTAVLPTVDSGSTTDPSTNAAARASSEASVLALLGSAGQTSTEINGVNSTVTAVLNQVVGQVGGYPGLVTTTGNLDTTLTTDNSQVTEIQQDVQTLVTDVTVLNSTLTTDLNEANQEITNLSTFQSLQLQMDIEENLARNSVGSGAVGLYELPAPAGYLGLVKTIVTNVVAQEAIAKGAPNATATADLNTANTDFTAGQYKTAYQYYSKAYHDAR